MARKFAAVPQSDDEQLAADRLYAERRFADLRRDEGPRAFAEVCAELRPDVVAALDSTDNLLDISGQIFIDDPLAWQVFRYVCGPPISQEDLWTLVGAKFQRVPEAQAEATANAIRDVVDPVRFPWVLEGRPPTNDELTGAVLATTVLWAAQRLGTSRRGEASFRQEQATADALAGAGYNLDARRTEIDVLDELSRGTYSRERKIAGAKCDVPARLNDGRLLALECKVSNGPKNGWKRVVREVGGKSEQWRSQFGGQVITGVVLAGVFDLSCLKTARNAGVAIFWEHDLEPLREFLEQAQ